MTGVRQDVISGVIPCTPNRPWKCLQCHFDGQDVQCKITPCTIRTEEAESILQAQKYEILPKWL